MCTLQACDIWTNGDDILCDSETVANSIADFLDSIGFEAVTGYFDHEEDTRSNETDACTGYYYVNI